MRRLVLAAVALTSLDAGSAPPARIDRVVRVDGALVGARAHFVVRRHVVVDTTQPGYLVELEMPVDGVAIGATVVQHGTRHRLALVPAEQASEQFDAMLEREPARERRSVVLLEHSRTGLELRAAMPITGAVALELELELPTCYHRDLRHVLVPDAWKDVLAPTLRLATIDPDELALACGRDASDHVWLSLPSPAPAAVFAFAGRLALPGASHFARLEVDTASELGRVPPDLATVIVVDTSRSMTPAQLAAQQALVAAYLRAAPDSRVQVVAFARHARALATDWTPARDAERVIAPLRAVTPQNGSNIDAGLGEAARWVARARGTRRILLVGDEQLPSRIARAPEALSKHVPPGTLLHVAVVSSHVDGAERHDGAALAPVAAATGGMAIETGAPVHGIDATLLVRPIAIDNVTVSGSGWTAFESCQDRIAEGEACVWWAEGDASSGPIAFEGMLWGTRITRVVRPDASVATMLARELSTDDGRFTAQTMDAIEHAARAVNGRWSLFGSWGGRGGYRDRPVQYTSRGSSSRTSVPSLLSGSGSRRPSGPTSIDLAPQLRAAVASCRANRPIVAQIETTLSEIVAVTVELGGAPLPAPERARLASCVEEAIWATHVEVPAHFPRGVSTAHF